MFSIEPCFVNVFPFVTPIIRRRGLPKLSTCPQQKSYQSKRCHQIMQATRHKADVELDDELCTTEVFRVNSNEAGMRIDKLIAQRFDEKSRTYTQTLLSSSCVTVDNQIVTTKSIRLSEGQLVAVRFLPQQRDLPLTGEDIPLHLLYEDEHIVVVNKPAGMVTHPAPGNWTGTLVHALCYRYNDMEALGGSRPGIVHRLDKGTSGALVVARSLEAHAALSEQFAKRGVRKEYVAITVGNPAGEGCIGRVINAPLGRSPTDRLRMTVLAEEAGGKTAETTVETVAHDARGLLHAVRLKIGTGRTHQIRVHLRHVRAPVLGDDLYGAHDVNQRFATCAPRPMLHAVRLAFRHPFTGDTIDVSAPLPEDMQRLLQRVVYPEFYDEQPGWR